MTLFVDPLRRYQHAKPGSRHVFGGGRLSSHLISDENDHTELLTFATKKLRMRPEWFQSEHGGHFDLTERKRAVAVRLGAVEVSHQQFSRIIMMKRTIQ